MSSAEVTIATLTLIVQILGLLYAVLADVGWLRSEAPLLLLSLLNRNAKLVFFYGGVRSRLECPEENLSSSTL